MHVTKELLKIDRKWQGGRNRKVIRVIWMSADLYRWTHWVVGFGCCVGKFCLFVISSTCSFSQPYCRVPYMWQFSSHDSSRWLTEEPRLYLFITMAKGFPGKLVLPVNRPELDQNRSDSELVLAHLQGQDLRYRTHFIYVDEISSQFCTCHGSWADMACANLWPYCIVIL